MNTHPNTPYTGYNPYAHRPAATLPPTPPPPPFDEERAVRNSTDTLESAAASLLALQAPNRKIDRKAVKDAIAERTELIAGNNLGDVEVMLVAQAQMLHHLFAHSLEAYATDSGFDRRRGYGALALKAQSYCRMTLAEIARLKAGMKERPMQKQKIEEPAIQPLKTEPPQGDIQALEAVVTVETPSEKGETDGQMEQTGAPQAGGENPAVATVEGGSAEVGKSPAGQPQECAQARILQRGDNGDAPVSGAVPETAGNAEGSVKL